MSLQCPRSPVYHTSAQQKANSRKAAQKYRYGTPKLRDLLREKCRLRVHEARQNSFQEKREAGDNMKQLTVSEILRQELAQLEHDINLQEEIYKELVDELNEMFAEQLEQEDSYLIEVTESNKVICPVCQKAELCADIVDPLAESSEFVEHNFHCYSHECAISFNTVGNLEDLRGRLKEEIDKHEQNCSSKLTFFTEPINTSSYLWQDTATSKHVLNAMCETCDYFQSH